ncbi:BORA [Acanthosepion pharaonis]|uniref:Protein aurora borealis n=1 Tax=Acanthosepion pharaonis TaxID=158019 RepID=A0A812E1J8_ACAPH|nr:BORA [Sepia pharaonis]
MILHTPQSVTSQLAWHHHSTPQSQVKNPFEIALVNQLQNSLVSPGIFTISTPSSDEKKFHWTIDQLAILHPVEFEDKLSQYASVISPTLEEKAQKDIEKYFATHVIVPSPAEDSVKFEKKENSLESAESKKFVEVGCQTTLSLPQNVNLYDILGEYMTYKEKKQDGDFYTMDSFSTSSLRRKLFCQGSQEDSFSSNKGSAKSEDESNSEDELPAPIPSTPDWDRHFSKDPLSSSPVNRRSRRYMTDLSCDSFGCAHSSPNFSPIGPPSSPLSSRSQHQGRKGSHIHLEDSRKQLFSSPCSSPVQIVDDLPERNSNLIVKKELELMNPKAKWSFDSGHDVSLISPEENPQSHSAGSSVYSICEKTETSLCAGDAESEQLCCMDKTRANDTKSNHNDTEDKNNDNAFSDLQNITSSLSANFSIIPSKLEVTNVDNSRYVSTLQHDTGYMSYNTTGSMPSRTEISQCSKSALSIYNTSSQEVQESIMDTARLLSEKALVGVPQSKTLGGLKTSTITSYADSLLDYDEVVGRAQQVLTLTSKFCTGQSEKYHQVAETDQNKSSDQTDMLQWQPIGASTPTHKGRHKSASEAAAEILQKAQEALDKFSKDKVILS